MVTKWAGRRAGGRGEGQQPTRSPSKTQHAFCSCRHPEPQPGWSREMGSRRMMALSPTWGGTPPPRQPAGPQPGWGPRAFLCLWVSWPAPATRSSCPSITAVSPGATQQVPPHRGRALRAFPTRREGSAGPRRSGRSSLSLTRAPISPPPPPPLQPGRAGRAWAMGRRRRQSMGGGAVGSEPPRRGGDTARKLWWWHLTGKTEPVRFLRTVDMHIAPQGHLR